MRGTPKADQLLSLSSEHEQRIDVKWGECLADFSLEESLETSFYQTNTQNVHVVI
jgi:hypothetical protein